MANILLPILLLLPTLLADHPCFQVTSSECDLDRPEISAEEQVSTEEACRDLCDAYADIGLGCTFAAWTIEDPDNNCRLYKEKFSLFLSHCDLVAGPFNLEDCDVDHPEDYSCEGLREGECKYYGKLVESIENMPTWDSCEGLCKLNSACAAWTYRAGASLCLLLDRAERQCATSYTPSSLDPSTCQEDGQNTTTTSTTAKPTTTTPKATTTTTTRTTTTTTKKTTTATTLPDCNAICAGPNHHDGGWYSDGSGCCSPTYCACHPGYGSPENCGPGRGFCNSAGYCDTREMCLANSCCN